MVLRLRISTPKDGDRVMEIWRTAVDATHDFLSVKDRQEIERELVDFLPSAPLWLAVDRNDTAIGFMLLNGSHMDALFVHSDKHGSGVGRMLVEHAIRHAPALTTTVNEQNTRAFGFYRRMGFQPVGRSATDDQGRPYPLIHLRYAHRAIGVQSNSDL